LSEPFEMGRRSGAPGDYTADMIDARASSALDTANNHPLDGEVARKLHRKMLDWYFHERARQAENRLQQSMDDDYYDGEQWSAEDAQVLHERRQVPLVFNEVAPMIDWLIGTERRTRVDWNVLPRTEDDVDTADAKRKVLKFVSDINRIPFARSRAFADAVKVGVGWVDDGARDDPTQDVLYSKYENWRNVLWDSSSYELDISDARYLFRWRWVDADVAEIMFPERAHQIRRSVIDAGAADGADDEDWGIGEAPAPSGTLYASGAGVYGEVSRRRIKLIECQYRMPVKSRIITDGPMKGAFVSQGDAAMADIVNSKSASFVDKVVMRMHVAVFTEADMLSNDVSVYRHNRFSLTPIWCYRRGKDRLPYGAIRRVRDLQQDLNKRASKALFMLSTNQVIADEGAVSDIDIARQEVDMPDGWVTVKTGKKFEIRRDTDAATGQVQMMTLDAQNIQRSVGVNNENLGRATNAVSGEAIKARQLQGSVGTTEPFDNLRFAVQVHGEKLLSLTEQFYSDEKVIRLTGNRPGKVEWLRINQPEVQPDGSVRYLNDITASQADFIVAEADYAGTLRQVMFDSLRDIAGRLPPELAVRFLRMAYEYSDLPNKDEITDEIRKITGEIDPNKEPTPEEAQAAQQQQQQQAEGMQIQREMAIEALNEQRAKVAKLNAEASKIMAEAQGGDGMAPEMEQAIRQVQEEAATRLEAMSEQLRKVQMDATNKTMAINRDADVKIEAARIDAASRERVAEIQNAAAKQIDSLMARLDEMNKAMGDVSKQAADAARAADAAAKAAEQVGKGAEDAAKKADDAGKAAADAARIAEKVGGEVEKVGQSIKDAATKEAAKPTPVPSPAAAPVINFTMAPGAIQVDAKPAAGNKTFTMHAGGQTVTGKIEADKLGD